MAETNITALDFIKGLGLKQENVELSLLLNKLRLSRKDKQRLIMLKLKGVSSMEEIIGKSRLKDMVK